MKPLVRSLPLSLFLAACCLVAQAAPDTVTPLPAPKRNALREAVEAHRAERRDEVRRQEAAMGRHLSPAELAELREQVRQQWMPPARRLASAQSPPVERIAPIEPEPAAATETSARASERSSALLVPAARSQRP